MCEVSGNRGILILIRQLPTGPSNRPLEHSNRPPAAGRLRHGLRLRLTAGGGAVWPVLGADPPGGGPGRRKSYLKCKILRKSR